ncbi:hypothetical protein ACFPYJ_06860 [Paenibacillus solisilvae]|uniref:Uncharacterized protein n=1 Tax=Paenibacillus solisilvae TaxID=2486751 RepID=A0ABW0VXD4_9BACL
MYLNTYVAEKLMEYKQAELKEISSNAGSLRKETKYVSLLRKIIALNAQRIVNNTPCCT